MTADEERILGVVTELGSALHEHEDALRALLDEPSREVCRREAICRMRVGRLRDELIRMSKGYRPGVSSTYRPTERKIQLSDSHVRVKVGEDKESKIDGTLVSIQSPSARLSNA